MQTIQREINSRQASRTEGCVADRFYDLCGDLGGKEVDEAPYYVTLSREKEEGKDS